MKRRKHILVLISSLLFFVPVGIGLTRSWVISLFERQTMITQIQSSEQTQPLCANGLCSQISRFFLPNALTSNTETLSIGYYGAFSDSWVRTPTRAFDKITIRNDLQLSWFKFKTYRIDPRLDGILPNHPIEVVSVSPVGTKKLGMNDNFLFVGSARSIEGLKQVYEFYKLHLYVLLALLLLGIKLFMFSSRQSEDSREHYGSGLVTPLTVLALIFYSHYLDSIMISLGAPQALVEGFVRVLWGPTIILQLRLGRRATLIALSAYLISVAPGLAEWSLRDIFFAGIYKWAVTAVTFLSIFQIAIRPDNRTAMVHFLPFALLLVADTCTIQGWLPLFSGNYLSPLGLFALPILHNLGKLLSIIQHHYFWHQKNKLSQELTRLKNSSGTASPEEWKDLLFRIAQQLAIATKAERVSICYLALDSPLIVGIRGTNRVEFNDGKLPPVFARVIQTGEEYWWAENQELTRALTHTSFKGSNDYRTTIATVLPIRADNEIYGALSLTDLTDPQSLNDNPELRKHMEDIINSYRDLLSIKLVRKKELSTNAAEKLSSTLVERFSEKAPFTSNPREAAGLLLELITEALPVRAMYFDYQPETEGLSLLCSSQMESHLVDLWASIPFKARATNRLSPFAICINEKRTVVIEDIRIYYALLAGVSVEALEASGGRGFVAHPVLSGEKITGLICLLQHSSSEPFFKDFRKALTTASGYLAYQLENFRAAHQVRDAERIIGRFADPALVRALSNASADDAILAGQSFKGVIIIQDMRGSTKASRRVNDPADLAARLSLIYRKAGTLAQRFGGSFEKGNGDGLITTLGTDEANNGALTLCFLYLNEVFEVARQSLQIQETVVVAHRGFLFKGVMGHLHRIAWDTCGSDLVDAFSIEKAAKQLPGIVLAISSQFVSAEPDPIKTALERYAKFTTTVEGLEGPVFFLDRAGAQLLHSIISASERNAA